MLMNYNLSTVEIFDLSWRKFRLLFNSLFSWNDEQAAEGSLPEQYAKDGNQRSHYEQAVHEARGAAGTISRSFDWDSAMGRPAPDSKSIITTQELLEGKANAGSRVQT